MSTGHFQEQSMRSDIYSIPTQCWVTTLILIVLAFIMNTIPILQTRKTSHKMVK